jgi:peptidoglycan/xylan/chitin deacetylase (PgdA/CDA1 family)
MKQRIKTAALSFFRFFRPNLSAAAILMYHSVADNTAFFTVSVSAFAVQIAYLAEQNYKVVFLSDLIRMIQEKKSIAGYVAITFDDGYRDFLLNALPILQKYRFPASVFLVSDMLGDYQTTSDDVSLPLMTVAEARQAQAGGLVEYFPHTTRHTILNHVPFESAIKDIDASKQFITTTFGTAAGVFAYPRGIYTTAIVEHLRKSAFQAAVTVREGLVAPATDLFLLPRLSVDSTITLDQFKAKLSDGYVNYLSVRNRL